jgi:hypothetical protein
MLSLIITSIKKEHSIPDAQDYLDVAFEITEDDEVVHDGRHGFPLDTPEETIKEDLQKFLATYIEDQERAQTNEKVEETQKQADETIQNLEGFEINAESNQ